MTTSLAQQLRSLSLPQVTSQFSSDRRRVSILFDEKEAANLDKATLHDIGVTGLTALAGVDPKFEKFHALLFSDAAVDFDRRVQTKETNDSLDASIESFLFRVSPYLLLRPAQKALEWLLFRFQIHIFNVDALLTAFLPFHETTVFVRVVQCLDLASDASKLNRWKWLAPLQKPGVPLSRQTLYKRLISDLSFLASFCEIPVKALAAFKDGDADDDDEVDGNNKTTSSSAPLRPFFSCYAASVIGALESTDDVGNKEIGILLKFVVKGLKSPSDDYRLATFMIVSALSSKKSLAKIVAIELIKCIADNLTEATMEEGLSCVAIVCHTQEELQSQPLAPEVLQSLWIRSDFISTLVKLQKSLNLDSFLETLAQRLVKNAVDSSDDAMLLGMLRSEVDLAPRVRTAMTRELFTSFKGMKEKRRRAKKPLLAKIFCLLQRKFPRETEAATKELHLNDGTAVELMEAANAAGIKGSELDSILLACDHPESIHRLAGVQSLVRFVEENRDSSPPSTSSTYLDVLVDDAAKSSEDLIREQRLRVGDAIVQRLRRDDNVDVVTMIVQSDVVMRRYVQPEEILSLLSKIGDSTTTTTATRETEDESGLWNYVEEYLIGRLGFLEYAECVERTDEEKENRQDRIFAHLLPRLLRHGGGRTKPATAVEELRRSNFAKSHPLLLKFSSSDSSEGFTRGHAYNKLFVSCVVDSILATKEIEEQKNKMDLLLAAARVDQPLQHVVAILAVTILARVLIDERFVVQVGGGDSGGGTSGVALEVLRLFIRFEKMVKTRRMRLGDDAAKAPVKADHPLLADLTAKPFSVIEFTFKNYEELLRAIMHAGARDAVDHFVNSFRGGGGAGLSDIRSTRQSTSFQFCASLFHLLMTGCASEEEGDVEIDPIPTPNKNLLRDFLLSQTYFPSTADAVGFLFLFWLPDETSMGNDIGGGGGEERGCGFNPVTQFEALNVSATLFHSLTFTELESLLCPPSAIVPLLLSALSVSPHLRVRTAATNCFHALLFALKTFHSVSTPFQGLMEAIVEASDAVVVDPRRQLPRLVAEAGKTAGSPLIECLVGYICEKSTDAVLRERLVELTREVEGNAIYESLLPGVDCLIDSAADSTISPVTAQTITSTLRGMMRHFVDESVAPNLTSQAPATTSLLKAVYLTDALYLISPRFFAKLPPDSKKLVFSHLFRSVYAVDDAEGGEEEEETGANETMKSSQMARGVLNQLFVDASIVAEELTQLIPTTEPLAATSTIKETKRRKTEDAAVASKTADKKTFHRKVDQITDYIRSSAKKIRYPELLVPPLLKIVEYCLLAENESGEEAQRSAFSRDLCLATISSILVKLRAKDKPALEGLIPAKINVELIVQCIRSPNATRQSNRNALSIVNVAAEVAPKAVLPNVISIFTFVGEHLLRRDDGFSLQILEQTLDAIVPVLVADGEDVVMDVDRDAVENVSASLRVNENVAHALRVFVEASPHIPAHRKMTIFKHLVTRLEDQNVLWCLVVIAVEAQVLPTSSTAMAEDAFVDSIRHRHRDDVAKTEMQKLHESFHFWIELCLEFGLEAVVGALQRLVAFIAAFPEHLVSSSSRKLPPSSSSSSPPQPFSFVDHRRFSPRQIRQLLYYSSSFANQLMAACVAHPRFLDDQEALTTPIRSLVETVVNLILVVGRRSEALANDGDAAADVPVAKFWKGILAKGTELLDKINAKLSEKILLTVIASLMGNSSMNVKRKSLDLLAGQLSQMVVRGDSSAAPATTALDPGAWLELIPSLLWFLQPEKGAEKSSSASTPGTPPPVPPQTMQAALLCLKMLARIFGRSHPKALVAVVKRVTLLLAFDLDSVVRSSIFLTLAELCCCLKAQTVPLLNRIVPLLFAVILDPPSPPPKYAHDLLLVSSLTAVSKLLETIPEFLSPHLVKILVGVSSLSLAEEAYSNAEGPYKAQLTQRVPKIRELLVAKTPSRSFLPAVSTAFCSLNEKANHLAVIPLMDLLKRHLESLSKEDFNASVNQFAQFFVDVALDFRAKSLGTVEEAEVASVEGATVDAVVAMVMRMSEPTFRPFYYRLYDWAVEEGLPASTKGSKDRIITFYVVSTKVAESLKTLFGLFIGRAMKNVVEVLKRNCVVEKKNAAHDEDDGDASSARPTAFRQPVFDQSVKDVLLLRHVVDTLSITFKHDKKGDVARDNFDALHLPLIDHLENEILLREEFENADAIFENFVGDHLAPCLAAMATAVNDFATWKKMTYQICLKTKSDSTRARLQAIATLEAVALAIGQEFLGLLPETAPFLAELMEDEEEEVEKRVQAFIRVLEEQLGENLQKYFT